MTTILETALSNLPYDKFCVSDEVQEQVNITCLLSNLNPKSHDLIQEVFDDVYLLHLFAKEK